MVNNYNFRVFGEDKVFKGKQEKEMKIDGIDIFKNVVARHNESEELTTVQAWIKIFVIFTFTMLTIRIVQKTRRDGKVALETFHQDMSRYKDHECLKTRTIHLKGVIPEDRTGQGIENHLNKILKSKQMR
jgi:hypothetical protein